MLNFTALVVRRWIGRTAGAKKKILLLLYLQSIGEMLENFLFILRAPRLLSSSCQKPKPALLRCPLRGLLRCPLRGLLRCPLRGLLRCPLRGLLRCENHGIL